MKSTFQLVAFIATIAAPALAQGNWREGQWQDSVVTVTQHGPVLTFHETQVQPASPTSLTSTRSTFSTSNSISSQVVYPPSSSTPTYVPPTVPTPTTTPAPIGGGDGEGDGIGGGAQTFSIVNSYSVALSLVFDSNAGGPDPMGGNIAPTTIGAGSTTFYSFPTGWAGRISVGKTTHPANSKIEGSITGSPDMDVSYVDGYSVPIVCSSGGMTSGCNTELFGLNGNTCNQNVDISGFEICENPARQFENGPAYPFFAACQGKAYTYPKDDGANYYNVDIITHCCIGTDCPMDSGYKRSVLSRKGGHGHQTHGRQWNQPRSHVHRLVQDAKLKR